MRDDSKALARVWLSYIEDDLNAAELLIDRLPSGAAFHVQQAAEKCIKAAIALQGGEPARTHDLKRLYADAGDGLRWNADEAWLSKVSSWVATTRYPADVYGPPPRAADVQDAFEQAKLLADEIRAKLD